MAGLVRIELRAPVEIVDDVLLYLTQHATHGWEEDSRPGETVFLVYYDQGPAADEIARELSRLFPGAKMITAEVKEENWNAAWQEFFMPVKIGADLTVVPSWLAGESEGLEIIIHPAMAFGTGHHATTKLCLQGLLKLRESGIFEKYKRFLDLGTGSGILAIAAAKLGLTGIGLDIDPVAVENACLNARINKCGNSLMLTAGGIDILRPEPAFDLIMANILAGPLKDLAPAISSRIKPGGSLVLSGILTEQARAVIAAYEKTGLGNPATMNEGEWTAVVFAPQS